MGALPGKTVSPQYPGAESPAAAERPAPAPAAAFFAAAATPGALSLKDAFAGGEENGQQEQQQQKSIDAGDGDGGDESESEEEFLLVPQRPPASDQPRDLTGVPMREWSTDDVCSFLATTELAQPPHRGVSPARYRRCDAHDPGRG